MRASRTERGRHATVVIAAAACLGAATLGAAGPAAAQQATVIYRCTAASGAVALQDDPCPPGQREERREIAAFPTPRAPAPPSTPAPADRAAPAAVTPAAIEIAAADRPTPARRPTTMPPPLWRCTDLNGDSRLVDQFDPQPRCVPLSVLGVDLRNAPPAAANLCRWVEDECVELGGDAACAAWEERLAAARSAGLHAFSDDAASRRRDFERAKAVVENDCRP